MFLASDTSEKLVSKDEAAGGWRNCGQESSFTAAQFVSGSSGENRDFIAEKVNYENTEHL